MAGTDEGIFQVIMAIGGFTIEGGAVGDSEWSLNFWPFTDWYQNEVVQTWKDKVLRGGTTESEWDYRLIPREPAGSSYDLLAGTSTANLAVPALAKWGPLYLEDGTLVTPAHRPVIASRPVAPPSGSRVQPSYAFVQPNAVIGPIGLSSFSSDYVSAAFTKSPSNGVGYWKIETEARTFPGDTETFQYNFIATQTTDDILNGMASLINASSRWSASKQTGNVRMSVKSYSKPSYIKSMVSNYGSGESPESFGPASHIVSSPAPTNPWDPGTKADNTDGESAIFYIPEE